MGLVMMLAGCGGAQMVPEDQYYRIAAATPEQHFASPLLEGGLIVEAVEATAIYQDRAIVYREADAPLQLKRHHYQYWADSPAQLLQQYLLEYFSSADLAASVYAERYGVEARYRLRTRLKQFDQVYRPDGVGVQVAIRFELTDQTIGKRIAVQDTERTLTGRDAPSMHATVELFQEALSQLTADWVKQIATGVQASR